MTLPSYHKVAEVPASGTTILRGSGNLVERPRPAAQWGSAAIEPQADQTE